LLIKRVRYGIEAYPELDRLPEPALERLRSRRRRWAIGTIAGNGWRRPSRKAICNPASRPGRRA
jgi:hypothetical protein